VLNGTVAASPDVVFGGTVLRLRVSLTGPMPAVTSAKVIGSGFAERTDPAALVVGPTGVALGRDDTLYVADTVNSQIVAIPRALSRVTSAGTGASVFSGLPLNQPLGLITVPGGNIVSVNGGDGNAVELTPDGVVRHVRTLDTSGSPAGAGALFGLALTPNQQHIYFVDDATNELDLLH
jgi:sugar lactone lactonase YvrE